MQQRTVEGDYAAPPSLHAFDGARALSWLPTKETPSALERQSLAGFGLRKGGSLENGAFRCTPPTAKRRCSGWNGSGWNGRDRPRPYGCMQRGRLCSRPGGRSTAASFAGGHGPAPTSLRCAAFRRARPENVRTWLPGIASVQTKFNSAIHVNKRRTPCWGSSKSRNEALAISAFGDR